MARKPLSGTVAANVLQHGTGGLNVDGCRVATGAADAAAMARCNTPGSWSKSGRRAGVGVVGGVGARPLDTTQGRWPPNTILTHAPDCPGDKNGAGCVDGCAVGEMGAQSGVSACPTSVGRGAGGQHGRLSAIGAQGAVPSHGDTGTAARFFPSFRYCAKACRSEREAGLEPPADGKRANRHPTVKPIDLMRWLVRLVTPPGGVVLDPFTGSGTTGCAAALEGFAFIGCEQDEGHAEIARRRIAHWTGEAAGGEAAPVVTAAQDDASDVLPGQLALL